MLVITTFILDIIIVTTLTILTKLYQYPLGWLFIILIFILNFVLLIGLFWLECCIESLFISYKKRPSERVRKYFQFKCKIISSALLFFSLSRVKKIDIDESITKDHLIIFNHSSGIDALVLLASIPGYNHFYIVKKELFNNNFFKGPIGKIMFASGAIGIDRNDPMDGIRVIKEASNELSKHHRSIIVSPEGTRSHKQEINQMHAGTFKIAMYAKKDIVLLGIRNASLVAKHYPFRPTTITIERIATLDYEKFKDATTTEIKEEVEHIYKEYLSQK